MGRFQLESNILDGTTVENKGKWILRLKIIIYTCFSEEEEDQRTDHYKGDDDKDDELYIIIRLQDTECRQTWKYGTGRQ